MSFNPSPYQKAIFDFIENQSGSLIIEAVAGSGKTTTIIEALKRIPDDKSILFCAFNKAIANELEERVPGHVDVRTINGLGHRAWMKHVGGRVNLNSSKTWDIVSSKAFVERSKISQDKFNQLRAKIRKMVSLAKQYGIVPEGIEDAKGLSKDSIEVWTNLCTHHDLDFSGLDEEVKIQIEECANFAKIALTIGLEDRETIDFDDQLYMTTVFSAKMPKYDFVFVDEAQDISAIQRVLLSRCLKKDVGRLVAVGDPCQAIYGFRGADSSSLKNIQKKFEATSLPLSISYRCPKTVVSEAQKFVSHIQSHESAPDGKVVDLGFYNPKRPMEKFAPGDFIVCRNCAPLVRLALCLLRARMPAHIVGQEMGTSLVSLVRKLGASTLNEFFEKLDAWRQKETDKLLRKDPEANISRIEEKYDCLIALCQEPAVQRPNDIVRLIEEIFSSRPPEHGIKLSTIHKAKGLEAQRVIFLDPWLLPSRYAKQDWQKEQENNLSYVAITRAQNVLAYVSTPKKNMIHESDFAGEISAEEKV